MIDLKEVGCTFIGDLLIRCRNSHKKSRLTPLISLFVLNFFADAVGCFLLYKKISGTHYMKKMHNTASKKIENSTRFWRHFTLTLSNTIWTLELHTLRDLKLGF